mgnify:CR=1 FL=1
MVDAIQRHGEQLFGEPIGVRAWLMLATLPLTFMLGSIGVFDAAMPFGGYKESGWGREMGHNALENYLETKSVVTQLA